MPITPASSWTAPLFSKMVRLSSRRQVTTILTWLFSSTLQLVPYIAPKMSDTAHQDRGPPLHGREIPHQRSHHPVLRHLQVVPEQGPLAAPDGLLNPERAGSHR